MDRKTVQNSTFLSLGNLTNYVFPVVVLKAGHTLGVLSIAFAVVLCVKLLSQDLAVVLPLGMLGPTDTGPVRL